MKRHIVRLVSSLVLVSVSLCFMLFWQPLSVLSDIQSKPNIVFFRTSPEPLEPFELCSFYAAAVHNHKRMVLLLSYTITFQIPPYLSNLSNFKQLKPDFQEIFAETPLELWYKSRVWNVTNSVKRYRFLSDAVRTAYLYKYGGIYMDTDLIALKPFPLNLTNSVAMQLPINYGSSLGNTFLAFNAKHPFLKNVMEAHENIFDPNQKETEFSVFLFTKIYKKMLKDGTKGLPNLLGREIIFPFLYEHGEEILWQKDKVNKDAMKHLNQALTIHIWRNKLRSVFNKSNPIPKGGSVLYDIAKEHCPYTLNDWK